MTLRAKNLLNGAGSNPRAVIEGTGGRESLSSMMRHALLFAAAVAGALALTSGAKAQAISGFALDRFEPSERGSEWFAGDTLDLRGGARPAFGVVGDYAYKPLVFFDQNGNEVRPLIKHQLFLHIGASLNLADRVDTARSALRLPAYRRVATLGPGPCECFSA